MEFYIYSDRLFIREYENRNFTVMARATNQQARFDKAARGLLKAMDRWMDFSSFSQILSMFDTSGTTDKVLEDALFSLHAMGLADLKSMPSFGGTGVRQAGYRDYYALSDFCSENFNQSKSCTVSFGRQFFTYGIIHDVLKRNDNYIILKEKDSKILAAAMFGMSNRFFGGFILELKSVFFDKNSDEKMCRKDLTELVSYARENLKGKVRKIRYEYINSRQKFIVDVLKETGFREIARFYEELKNGSDLILLDLEIQP